MPLARQVITIEYRLALALAPSWLSTKSHERLQRQIGLQPVFRTLS